MKTRVSGLLAVIVFVVAVIALTSGVRWLSHEEKLPTQTSPDGQWQVNVWGMQLWTGSVEVTAQVLEPGGSSGRYVRGVVSSFEEFREKFSTLEFRGDEAFADGEYFVRRRR